MRGQASKLIASIVPNMHVQLAFNQLAGTSMNQHMDYLHNTEQFHEKLRLFFYPKIFEKQAANTIDWDQFTPEYYTSKADIVPLKSMAPLLLASIAMILISIPIARKL